MFVIAEIAGKQYKLEKGITVEVDHLKDAKEGDKLKLDTVLLRSNGAKTDIGAPFVSGAGIEIEVKAHTKGEKIRVYKKKPKKRYERTQGHRQQYSQIEVLNIK
ncbi:50S ribosomal protein L21 [Candidatus Peregrinibacteria bacterium]|nr:MAG: 50S ribosomal protein L21 [Candidatus Peregrinibacteria bacterium]